MGTEMVSDSIPQVMAETPEAHYENSSPVSQEMFAGMLSLEQKRCERSGRSFVLVLVHSPLFASTTRLAQVVTAALCRSIRDIDIKGWYRANSIFGVIFTEIDSCQGRSIAALLLQKVSNVLETAIPSKEFGQVRLSCRVFPEDWAGLSAEEVRKAVNPQSNNRRKLSRALKRSIDIAGSLFALVMLSPLLAMIAGVIKLTSKGPILFRQSRHGWYGESFIFLKFRSMYEKNDPKIHEEYMQRLISGDPQVHHSGGNRAPVYKMTNDPRVTPVGRFLRRTSLDELPQLLNVLSGHMSLVGPRPPLPYEVAKYARWHVRRLWEAKPGITGLWQVHGRSRTTFDEMVRLDVHYGRTWSIWLDLKILLLTPWAVLTGSGAY
jgi:exopolysaccharide biosynthesis polyprenyl glycosylphosphotransferase